jgi:hypothetical protein
MNTHPMMHYVDTTQYVQINEYDVKTSQQNAKKARQISDLLDTIQHLRRQTAPYGCDFLDKVTGADLTIFLNKKKA